MPKRRRSTPKVEEEDLQSFLNNFHKEIEDGNVVTITPENAGEDKVVRKILLANRTTDSKTAGSGAEEGEVDKEIYYLDDEGNCYIKTTPRKQQELKRAAKKAAAESLSISLQSSIRLTRSAGTSTTSKGKHLVTVRQAKPAATSKRVPPIKASQVSDMEEAAEEQADDPAPSATPTKQNANEEVYEFAEMGEAEEEDDADDVDFVITNKQFKLKPLATTTAESAAAKYGCSSCNYTTNKKFLITRHMRTHAEERPFMCSLCDRGFKSNIGLVNHLNTHLGKRPHQCKLCESAFTTSGELIRHTRYKHTKEKPHKCTECSYASVELTKLRRHMTCHTGERPYQCPHCTYASPDMFKLKRHMVTHTGERKYVCDICNSRFTQSNSLKSHKLIHSVVDKPVFQCTLCPTTCGRKADLRMHITNMHSSDKPIACRRCGQELPDRYQYKLHIKTHEGEKCYRCTLCSYASVSQRHLESHMLIHTDEKPFKCDFCSSEFRQRQLLRRHVNIFHNSEYKPPAPRDKLHPCPMCPRTFTHNGNLMRHMETHDPTQNTSEKKLKLKMGRSVRLQADGTVLTVVNEADLNKSDYNDDNTEDDEDGEEVVDFEQFELMNEDDLRMNLIEVEDVDGTIVETVAIKKERVSKKPIIINRQLGLGTQKSGRAKAAPRQNSATKTFRIKEEPESTQFTVDVQGEEQYVVLEVVNSDDDTVETHVKREPHSKQSTSMEINASNCFGFEDDDDADEGSYEEMDEQDGEVDGASQEFMQLINMIEQDN